MSFHFQPDLSPWLSDAGVSLIRKRKTVLFGSFYCLNFDGNLHFFERNTLCLRSRMLITTIPSSMYVFNEDGVNLTLQAAAGIIVDRMNKLYTDGVSVRDVASDEALNLKHLDHYICWLLFVP